MSGGKYCIVICKYLAIYIYYIYFMFYYFQYKIKLIFNMLRVQRPLYDFISLKPTKPIKLHYFFIKVLAEKKTIK